MKSSSCHRPGCAIVSPNHTVCRCFKTGSVEAFQQFASVSSQPNVSVEQRFTYDAPKGYPLHRAYPQNLSTRSRTKPSIFISLDQHHDSQYPEPPPNQPPSIIEFDLQTEVNQFSSCLRSGSWYGLVIEGVGGGKMLLGWG
ncbi:uncharacterized protein An01g13760 [Aspergillus niger]|uniref:Contig An01c0440, genomic contig n=2 Tax=Aspergillus niger TaxID=5061 RepID=A2QB38_ASPNC|nr:uncharacterized protein An01g13760 [Aspergillus niger]CAK37382.1 unnamed protein product [Aspergillus niger]